MNNKNKGGKGTIIVIVVIVIIVLGTIAMFSENNSSTKTTSQSKYEKSLYDAYDKKKNGGTLTPAEQRAWDDYKEWERKNY